MEQTRRAQRAHRRPAPAGRTGKGKQGALTAPERRRLLQLGASIALFLLVFVGRGVFPDQTSQWQAALVQNTDFRGAFSRLGAAVSRGEPLKDTLGALWTEVFADGALPVSGPGPEWDLGPTLAQRVGRQLTQPGPVIAEQAWEAERSEPLPESGKDRARTAPAEPTAGEGLKRDQEAATASVTAASSAEPAVTVAQTAQAERWDAQGRDLPASVSTAFYELGLEQTATPVASALTSDYGYRDHPVTGDFRFHRGVDLGAPAGTEIAAFAGGTVAFTGRNDTCGLYLQLDHGNGVSTFYCHCSELEVLDGQTVEVGQTVAKVGETGNATGPHLHFAVIKDGVYLDPLYYINVGVS